MMSTGGTGGGLAIGSSQRHGPAPAFYPQPQQQHITAFRTKRDVDQHVEHICKMDLSEKEKSLRYYSIARSYASVKEFNLAKRFLQSYIDAHPTAPGLAEAYKVMGDILSDLRDYELALESYKKSHDITPSRVTLNRICDLLSNGHGESETNESRKDWFTRQKTASSVAISDNRVQAPHQRLETFQNPSLPVGSSPRQFYYPNPNTSSPNVPFYHNGGPGTDFAGQGQQPLRTPQRQLRTPGHAGDVSPRNLLPQFEAPLVNGTVDPEIQQKYLDKKLDEFGKQLESSLNQNQQKYLDKKFEIFGKLFEGILEHQKSVEDKFEKVKISDLRVEDSQKQTEKKLDEMHKFMKATLDEIQTGMKNLEITVQKQYKESKDNVDGLLALMENASVAVSPIAAIKSSPWEPRKAVESTSEAAPAVESPNQLQPSTELFKKAETTWKCTYCYMENHPDALKCPSCETLQPGVDRSKAKVEEEAKPTDSKSTNSTPQPAIPPFSFGLKSGAAPSFSFGDLAAKKEGESGFGFGGCANSVSIFAKSITPIFGVPATSNPSVGAGDGAAGAGGDDHDDTVEEFVPTAEFAPVIPLPPLVEVSKGDENENTIYEIRAKLLRLWEDDDGKKEWKERGLGPIKILQHKDHPTKVRIVMWREQIHKLACNHRLTKDTKINFFNNSEKTLMWDALDFAEGGEGSKEIFVCKFGKAEQCKEFKGHVDRLLTLIENSPYAVAASPIAPTKSSPEAGKEKDVESLMKPLSELFKKAEGTWDCSGCYMNNKAEALKCPSCETPQPGVDPSKIKAEEAAKSTEEPNSSQPAIPAFTFGFKSGATPSFGFGDLVKKEGESGFGFGGPNSANIFTKPIAPIFGTSATPNPPGAATGGEDHEDNVEEFVPTAEFTPVIPLPPLVEVSKGDENENTIYEVRAKLLRLWEDDDGKKEWKERGLGPIKILQEKDHPTKVRIVMWREQIHKLACNHRVTKDTKINFFNNSEKTLMWHALDFAEGGEGTKEIFVCKFGKAEQCKEFKGHVDSILTLIENSPDPVSPIAPTKSSPEEAGEDVKTPMKPLSELFKKAEGTWDCSGCYMNNKPEALKCPSCETLQPGVDPSRVKAEEEAKSIEADSTPQPVIPAFTFGFKSGATPAFGFGDLIKKEGETGFGFEGASNSASIFTKPIAPMFGASPTSNPSVGAGQEHDDTVEEFVPTAEFAPVIPLPPLVEVSKGDENENTIYEIRAKLLRLWEDDDGKKEWKERGLGPIKVLQHKDHPTKVRIVMWREQIHKLACNHRLTKDTKINFFNNSEKTLMWDALDFAEGGEGSKEIFVCKFGKAEQCKEFKGHVDRLVTLIENSPDAVAASPIAPTKSSEAGKDVESLKPLSELFKKAEGTWDCSGCYMNNKAEALKCPSCETPQPGVDLASIKEAEELKPPKAFVSQFNFGFKPLVPSPEAKPLVQSPETKPLVPSPEAIIPNTSQLVKEAAAGDCSPSSCTGCIGCDPDNFDFSKCENREVPTYPEQMMTPEEYKQHKSKEKLATFSFASPTNLNDSNVSTASTFSFTTPKLSDSANPASSFSFTNLSEPNPSSTFSFTKPNEPAASFLFTNPKLPGEPTLATSATFSFTNPKLGGDTSPPEANKPVPVFSGFGATNTFTSPSSPFKPPVFGVPPPASSFTFGSPSSFLPMGTLPAPAASNPIVGGSDKVDHAQGHGDEDDDEYEDEEPIFESVAKVKLRKHGESEMRDLGTGLVCLAYDSEMYCYRFTYLEETEDIPAVDHIICADTQLNSEGELGFYWSALMDDAGYLQRMEIQVMFDDIEIATQFLDRWSDSTEMATQANVTEEYLAEEDGGEGE